MAYRSRNGHLRTSITEFIQQSEAALFSSMGENGGNAQSSQWQVKSAVEIRLIETPRKTVKIGWKNEE